MIILGIDPGIAIVGWGVIDYTGTNFTPIAYGSITTPKEMTTEQRLAEIYRQLTDIINKYHPQEMAVEELFFNTNQTTGIRVAEARGVILLAGHMCGLPIAEYTPLQVKTVVTGYGKAKKTQVMNMTKRLLSLEQMPKLDATADVLAIAICYAQACGAELRWSMQEKI